MNIRKEHRFGLLIGLMLTIVPFTVIAQDATSQANTEGIEITSPLSVSQLEGQVEIIGTANIPNMFDYYFEFRPLTSDSYTTDSQATWFPATGASETPVVDGTLGVWDTTLVPDGVYEIRLVVTDTNGQMSYASVSPLRVDNTNTSIVVTVQPTPVDTRPRVTATANDNVRYGDSVNYPVVGYLLKGDSALVQGVSSNGNNWYYIELSGGSHGWISPVYVTTSGDFGDIPAKVPPSLPTPTPQPTVVPQPTPVPPSVVVESTTVVDTQPNVVTNGISLKPSHPVCDETFKVYVNVTNDGTDGTTARGGIVDVVDTYNGKIQGSNSGTFPQLNPGDNYVVVIKMTINTKVGKEHDLLAVATTNDINDTSRNQNSIRMSYKLKQGSCSS